MYSYRFFALAYLTTLVCADLNNLPNRAAHDHDYGWYPDMRTTSEGQGCETTKSLAGAHESENITVLISVEHFNTSVITTSHKAENVRSTLTATITLTETVTAQAETSSAAAGIVMSLITIDHTVTMSAISTLTITLPAMSGSPTVVGTMSNPSSPNAVSTNPTIVSTRTSSLLNTSHSTMSSMSNGISFSLVTSSSGRVNTTMKITTTTSRTSNLPVVSVANNTDKFTLKPSTSSVAAAKATTNAGSKSEDSFRILSFLFFLVVLLLFY